MSGWENMGFFEVIPETGEIIPGEVFREIIRPPESYERIESHEGIIGNPEEAENWHLQEYPMSCAVACQEFVAESLLKEDFSESRMRDYAREHDWLRESGTALKDTGKLLEAMGLEVTRETGATVNDLSETLKEGGKLIVGVNNMILENPLYALMPGITANHAVQVIGIDTDSPNGIEIILNDPGVENGAGRRCSLSTFEKAWKTSDCFVVSAYRGKAA